MVYRIDITARLQRRMLEIVGTALPLITKAREDADLIGLAHLRDEMIVAMDAYCCHIQDTNGDATLKDGCTNLRAAYDAFRERWIYRDGIEHWHEYRLSAIVMMKQVRALVQDAERSRDDDAVTAARR